MLLPRDNKLRALVNFESYWTANEFGFDPATKEYKVICIWRISGWLLQYFEGCGEYTTLDEHRPVYEACYRMCEILTLGKDTAWRRIDKVPPSDYCQVKHGS